MRGVAVSAMTGLGNQRLSRSKPVLGISCSTAVKLDFDGVSFKTVKYWALRTMRWFRLGGFVILKSSEGNYHVVFNRRVTWKRNVKIMSWVAVMSQLPKLKDYVLMQCIKGCSTLRVSRKGDKPSPRIVYRYGKQDGEVRNFLLKRRQIWRILRRMENGEDLS